MSTGEQNLSEALDEISRELEALWRDGSDRHPLPEELLPEAAQVHKLLSSGASEPTIAQYLAQVERNRRDLAPTSSDARTAVAKLLRTRFPHRPPTSSERRPLPEFTPEPIRTFNNVIWGCGWGLRFAIAFSLLAVAMTIITRGGIIERQGVSLLASVALYFFGGITGGMILGLFRPLTRRRLGAALVGIVVMISMAVVTGMVMFGQPTDWNRAELTTVVLMPVLYGVLGGWFFWEPSVDDAAEHPAA